MTTATDILDYYTESNRKMEEIRQAMADCAKKDLVALFGFFPELNDIVLRGYTPGFNDGDPCTHSMLDPFINGQDKYGDTPHSRYDEDEDEDEDEEGEAAVVVEMDEADRKIIAKILGGMTDAIEALYDTNFEVTVSRQADGTVTVKKDYYDCGH